MYINGLFQLWYIFFNYVKLTFNIRNLSDILSRMSSFCNFCWISFKTVFIFWQGSGSVVVDIWIGWPWPDWAGGGSEWNPIFGVEVYIICGAYCRGCKLYKVCVGVNGDAPVITGCCPYIVSFALWMAYVRLSVGVGGALDMFEFELFIRARFRAFLPIKSYVCTCTYTTNCVFHSYPLHNHVQKLLLWTIIHK